MKPFRSLVVLKRPPQELWESMRDHLMAFAGDIADIEEVRQLSRTADADGTVHIVNAWRVRQQVPPAVRSMLKIDGFGWTDRNTWDAATFTCAWTIEPDVLAEHITCSGQTQFEATMAGRGTRVTFSGELDVKPGLLSAIGSTAPYLPGFVESIVSTLIPRNLRNVVEAAAAFRQRTDQVTPPRHGGA